MTSRPSSAAPILVAIAMVLLPLGAYVGGYFWLGEILGEISTIAYDDSETITQVTRVFPHAWQVNLYQPAALVESWSRGIEVQTTDVESWVANPMAD